MIQKKYVILIIIVTALVSFGSGWILNNLNVPLVKKDIAYEKPINETDSIQKIVDSITDAMYPEYQVYGMHQEKDKQRQKADRLYKFRFTIVGGCEVDDKTRVRAEMQNEKTNKIMTSRYGKNWMAKFESSVDSIYNLDSLAIDIAQKDKRIRKIELMLKKYESHILVKHDCWETSDKNKRMVTLYAESPTADGMKLMNQFRAAIDLKNKKVINLDSIPFGY